MKEQKLNKVSKFKEAEAKYKEDQLIWKTHIRLEQNKFKRFLKWCWFFIAFPWKWLWVNIRDWRTLVIFVITVLVVGSEVWVPLLLGWIFDNY